MDSKLSLSFIIRKYPAYDFMLDRIVGSKSRNIEKVVYIL